MRALVVGLGVAGESAARRLGEHGYEVVVVEDAPTDASRARAQVLGVELLADAGLAGIDVVVPSPPVPPHHRLVQAAVAAGVPVWSEFELAARWSSLPMVAITGTNGKTTVTTLVEDMLARSGRRTVAAGNNDVPLVDALGPGLDVVVVEASSFRLAFTETFRPAVALWLNLAPDHLDWHGTMDHYRASKARVWAAQGPDDLAIGPTDDPVVAAELARAPGRRQTFGDGGDWRAEDGRLLTPDGEVIVAADELWRATPHDVTNALAASAAAVAAGATLDGVRTALRRFRGLPHRISLVGEDDGVRYFDDSKATDPHAALAAVRSFDSVVLLAGGRNKGLDLSVLAEVADRLRTVVAMGESAPEVTAAFGGTAVPVVQAASMDEAVALARAAARPGDAVLLSPGCASFDRYRNYGERGDDFARAVREVACPA